MKRTICLFFALSLLFLAGCHSEEPAPSVPPATPTPTAAPPESRAPRPPPRPPPAVYPPHPRGPGRAGRAGQKPGAGVGNHRKTALPQQGNSQADIIYELLAEGGITRMLAVYQDPSQLGLIGSVRSARQYYWEIAQGHDAVFIHAGGSPEFYNNKNSQGFFTVDGVNGYYSSQDAGMFWRDRDRVAGHHYDFEHSLLTSGQAITDMMAARELEEHSRGYAYEMAFVDGYAPAVGELAATITVPFSSYKTGVFRYDVLSGLYNVEEYGEPYIDGNDGSQVAVTNLLVLQTTYVVQDNAGRVKVDLSAGNGWFACCGRIIPIKWEKGGSNDQFRYFTEDGAPLALGQGKSYVCVIPTSRSISVE